MGFDVVYLPPIHPIGRTHRKGRNNTLTPGPDDPGSRGRSARPRAGTTPCTPTSARSTTSAPSSPVPASSASRSRSTSPCSARPTTRGSPSTRSGSPTGPTASIAYAENPPKKYQDIYPLYFDNDPDGIHAEVLRVVRHWIATGVRIFRVDNPHTKPVAFWERLFASVRETDPDVVFLAEAFTQPAMMRVLGEVGFQQSYTYFTWRNEKWELEEYFRELSGPLAASMRPNVFVNTPDILPAFLQYGGPGGVRDPGDPRRDAVADLGRLLRLRALRARGRRPGSEEYLDSEKYEYRPRDWAAAEADGAHARALPHPAQRAGDDEHPALQRLRNLHFHRSSNDKILVYSKREGDDVVLVVCTLDPHGAREGVLDLDLPALGLDWGDTFAAHDLVTGQTWPWGQYPYVRLDPYTHVAHILHVRPGAV